jgi:hypothetical protein
MTHRDQSGTEAPRAFDGDPDRLVAGEMTERVVRVENNGRTFVCDYFAGLLERHGSFPEPVQVHLDQHNPMRGLTFDVRINERPGDGSCRAVRDTDRDKQPRYQRAQLIGRDGDGAAHVTFCRSRAAI